jgi:hypothetical protein
MGAVFTLGSNGVTSLALAPGRETGMLVTFAIAAILGAVALAIVAATVRQAAQSDSY